MIENYFDLHCDTVGEAYKMGETLNSSKLQFNVFESAEYIRNISQIFAVYSPDSMSEEQCYLNFIKNAEYMRRLDFPRNVTPYLAVEGGKLLAGDIKRVDEISKIGVSVFTLVWGGECCVGGAHNTDKGFTEFGFSVADACIKNKIIMDVSHASDRMFFEVNEICRSQNVPFIASHSNSRTVRFHTRNLTDDMFLKIRDSGGIVGISLACEHLSCGKEVGIDDVASHIEHYFSLGGSDCVCLGCDYDGIEYTPVGLEKPHFLYKLADRLISLGYKNSDVDAIFHNNASKFFIENRATPFFANTGNQY